MQHSCGKSSGEEGRGPGKHKGNEGKTRTNNRREEGKKEGIQQNTQVSGCIVNIVKKRRVRKAGAAIVRTCEKSDFRQLVGWSLGFCWCTASN